MLCCSRNVVVVVLWWDVVFDGAEESRRGGPKGGIMTKWSPGCVSTKCQQSACNMRCLERAQYGIKDKSNSLISRHHSGRYYSSCHVLFGKRSIPTRHDIHLQKSRYTLSMRSTTLLE